MTDSGDLTTWNTNGAHTSWIDLSHGRTFKEDALVIATPDYIPLVETSSDGINWITVVENTWNATDNDYYIDYSLGQITFNSALIIGDQVRATFYKAGVYYAEIAPAPGKRLKLTYVEVQFTKDIEMNSNVNFEIWAYNPADLPNKVMVVRET